MQVFAALSEKNVHLQLQLEKEREEHKKKDMEHEGFRVTFSRH